MNKNEKAPVINASEGAPQKAGFDLKTLGRLLSYMKDYKGQLIFVVVCILLSAVASAASSLFLQSLIDIISCLCLEYQRRRFTSC